MKMDLLQEAVLEKLKSENAELKSENAELKAKNAELSSDLETIVSAIRAAELEVLKDNLEEAKVEYARFISK